MQKVVLKNNKKINYLEAGISNNKTIILLHGLGNKSTTWKTQLSNLSQDFHVIAWDAPGYGESFNPHPLYNKFSSFSSVLLEFIEILNISHFYLVGHSMGAAIAIDFSYRFPNKVKKLVIAAPTRGSAFISEEQNKQQLKNRLHAVNELGPYQLARNRTKDLFSDYAPLELIKQNEKIMQQVRSAGYSSVAYSLYNLDQKNVYPYISMPTLIICGEEDTITPVSESEYIHQNIPNSKIKLIPRTGHLCFVEAPTEFSCHVISFFTK